MNSTPNPLIEFAHKADIVMHKWNHYFDIYHKHFAPFKTVATPQNKIVIVEIGIWQGGSLKMWIDYFGPDCCELYGIDNNPLAKEIEKEIPNLKVFIGDQANATFLKEVISKIPAPHIVLDDGGHLMIQQCTSLLTLFEHVRPGGIYLCEDLHTSYWHQYGGGLKKAGTFIELVKEWVDKIHAYHYDPHTQDPIARTCSGIHFYDSVIVLDKAPKLIQPPQGKHWGSRRVFHDGW